MAMSALGDKRLWIAGGGLVAVIAVALSWLTFISPALDSASSLRAQTRDENFSNSLAEAQNSHLATLDRNLPALQATLAAKLAALPPDSGLPAFATELTNLAGTAKVAVAGVVVGTISPYSPTGASTGSTGAPATSSPTTGSTSTTSATPASSTGTTSSSGVYSIAVTIQSSGRLTRQMAFLKGLETGARHVVVISTQLSTAAGARVASVDAATQMTTQLTLFCSPMTPAQLTQLTKLLATGH